MSNFKILVLDGMTSVQDSDLNGLALSFINKSTASLISPNLYGGGLVGSTDFTVGSGTGAVSVTTGRAWLPNAVATGTSTNMYGIYLDSTLNVSIASNSSGNPRIDYIVLSLNLNLVPSATGNNIPQLTDVLGTPTATPTPPTSTQITTAVGANNPYLILAQVGNIPNGFVTNSTAVTSGMITPIRQFAYFTTGINVPVQGYTLFTDQSVAPSNPPTNFTELFTIGSNLFLRQPTSYFAGAKQIQIGSTSLISNGSSGGTPAVDWSQGIAQAYTFSANATFSFSNPIPGAKLLLLLTQPASGGPYNPTWPSGTNGVIWPNGVAPVGSQTASATDIYGFIYDNVVNRYRGVSQTGYAL